LPVSSARLDSSAEAEDRERMISSLANCVSSRGFSVSLCWCLAFFTSSAMIFLSCDGVSFILSPPVLSVSGDSCLMYCGELFLSSAPGVSSFRRRRGFRRRLLARDPPVVVVLV